MSIEPGDCVTGLRPKGHLMLVSKLGTDSTGQETATCIWPEGGEVKTDDYRVHMLKVVLTHRWQP